MQRAGRPRRRYLRRSLMKNVGFLVWGYDWIGLDMDLVL